MNSLKKIMIGVASFATFGIVPLASAQTMTGASLGATALSNAATGSQTVLTVVSQTVAYNIQFFLLAAAVAVGVFVVKFIMRRFTRVHRG